MPIAKEILKSHVENINNHLDLLNILNIAKKKIYGGSSKPIALKSLYYYGNTLHRKNCFTKFVIYKKNGKVREITAPVKGLKVILRCMNYILTEISNFDSNVHGFVKGKSIVSNAKRHLNSNYILNVDLKDFFDSIDQNRIKLSFMFGPFNFKGAKEPLAYFLSLLCSVGKESKGELINVLPQGSPVSPIISNIVCEKLDRRLNGLAKRFNLRYSRYADDISFSSLHNFVNNENFFSELNRIIEDQGFLINPEKTRYQPSSFRQEVTGLIVNDQVNVKRKYIKTIRMYLYYWEKYGLEKAQEIYFKDSIVKNMKSPNLVKAIRGKLDFLKMVKGAGDKQTEKLLNRYLKLNPTTAAPSSPTKIHVKDFRTSLPILHEAYKLSKILSVFSIGNNPLKYTTHTWEPGRFSSIEDFYKQIQNEWDKIWKEIIKVNPRLHAKISNFIFRSDLGTIGANSHLIGWGVHNLKFGWSSKELSTTELESPLNPADFIVPEEIRLNESLKGLYHFKDYIEVFKNEIEIREENSGLKKIFFKLWEEVLGYDFNLILENLDGISFFTDVQWLNHGLKLIFSQFRQRPEFPDVKVSAIHDHINGIITLYIVQIGSHCKRDINDKKIRVLDSGDFLSISEALRNICDWSIEAQFNDDKCYRINYLTSSSKLVNIETISSCQGFTHILKFYI